MIDWTSDSSTHWLVIFYRAFTGHCGRLGKTLKPKFFVKTIN
jgi:hypothetical protein